MRSYRAKIAGILAAAAVLLGVWIFFAPTKLGGTSTYSITDGISMNPLLYKGDFAVIRAQSNYHVGDVVLYQSQVLHKPVLHRIILIQNGNYFFKGDNNDFVDPGYATRSELVGKLWFHIPHVGSVLGWFGVPAHASLLAGVAAMAVVLTGAKTSKGGRRRRARAITTPSGTVVARHDPGLDAEPAGTNRRGYGASGARRPGSGSEKTRPDQERRSGIVMTPLQVAHASCPLLLRGPEVDPDCPLHPCLACGGLPRDWLQPTTPPDRPADGRVSTDRHLLLLSRRERPDGGVSVRGGQDRRSHLPEPRQFAWHDLQLPLYLPASASHHGHHRTQTLVLSKTNTWQSLATGKVAAPFSGDRASVSNTLALNGLYDLINTVSAQSGVAGANYAVDVQPVVRITGTVGGNPIKATFLPVLPFQVAPASLTLDVPVAPAPPGATYVAPTAASALAAGLNPTQSGNVPHIYPNLVSVAKYEIRVSLLRSTGLVFAVLAVLVAVLHDVLRRRKTVRSDEELIAKQFGSLIVPVDRLSDFDATERLVVLDFAHLAGLAHYLERPILYEMKDGQRRYEVDDETRRYVYQPAREG